MPPGLWALDNSQTVVVGATVARHSMALTSARRMAPLAVAAILLIACFRVGSAGSLPVGGVIRAPMRGPCSAAPVFLTAGSVPDLMARMAYANTTTVVLYLTQNITLESSLLFNSSFSCTILRPQPGLSFMPWIWYPKVDQPAVRLNTVTNMQIIGIAIGFPFKYRGFDMIACSGLPEFPNKWTCPAVHLYRVWAVTFANGYIYGRTDVYRAGSTEFTYMRLFHDYYDDMTLHSWSTIRFALCGDAVNLIRSMNRVTNCDIRGSWTSVLLYGYSVGIIIANNYVTDFQFGGIQCGLGDSNVADCMLNTIQDNFVTAESKLYPLPNPDGSGIYYDLHWYNPGNLDSCNYIVAGTHCYYLDFTTSGLTIDGAICVRNNDGVKINTGHGNKIKSVVIVSPRWQAGIMSCQNWCENNCNAAAGRGLGHRWYTGFLKIENAAWRKNWPFLTDICNRNEWLPGIKCNPNPPVEYARNWTAHCSQFLQYNPLGKQLSANAAVTSNCSGVPGLNNVEMIIINGTRNRWNPYFINCDALPSVTLTNNMTSTSVNYPSGFFEFDNQTNEDFGVSNLSSRIYQLYPDFMTCSKKRAGIQRQARLVAASASAMQSTFSRTAGDWWSNTYGIVGEEDGAEITAMRDTPKLRARLANRLIQPKKPKGKPKLQKPKAGLGDEIRKEVGKVFSGWGRRTMEVEDEDEGPLPYGWSVEPPTDMQPLGGNAFDHIWLPSATAGVAPEHPVEG